MVNGLLNNSKSVQSQSLKGLKIMQPPPVYLKKIFKVIRLELPIWAQFAYPKMPFAY